MLYHFVQELLPQNTYPTINEHSNHQSIPDFVLLFAVLSLDRTGGLTKLLDSLLVGEGKYSLEQKTATKQILSLISSLYTCVALFGPEGVYEKLKSQFPERSSEWQNVDPEKQVRAIIELPIQAVLKKVASYIEPRLLLETIEANSALTPANELKEDKQMINKIIESLSRQKSNEKTWLAPKEIQEYISKNVIEAAKRVFNNLLEKDCSITQLDEDKAFLQAVDLTCYGFCNLGIIAILQVVIENRINLTSKQKYGLVNSILRYSNYSKAKVLSLLQFSLCEETIPSNNISNGHAALMHIINTLDAENRLKEVLTEANIGESGPDELNNEQYSLLVELLEYSSEFYFVTEIVGRDAIIKGLQAQANFGLIPGENYKNALAEFFSTVLHCTARYIDVEKFLRAILSTNNTTTEHGEKNVLFRSIIEGLGATNAIELYLGERKKNGVYAIFQAIREKALDASEPKNIEAIVTSLHKKCEYPISVLLRAMMDNLKTPK